MAAMAPFDIPVRLYMTRGVFTVQKSTPISSVWEHMRDHHVSSVCVVDEDDRMVGVVSRADLLREGTVNAPGGGPVTLELPKTTAAELMLGVVVSVSPEETLQKAATTMVDQHIHRVFVDHGDGIPVGVLSVRDLMQAVVDKHVATPVSDIMVSPVMSIDVKTTLAAATDVLATGAMTGVIVTDGKWPAGVFTQEDAILARAHAPETPVERVMSNELVVLPPTTPVYRAAGQSIAMHVRRVVVLGDDGPAGIFTGLDIARVVATAR